MSTKNRITVTITIMLTESALQRLIAWTSPSYPVGAFTYSHGLETAVSDGRVHDLDSLVSYVDAVLAHGGGWIDAVLFIHAWRTASDNEDFDGIAQLATAFRSSSETALESYQQGRSFLSVTRRAWPHPVLDAFAGRWGNRPIAHCAILGLACAVHDIALNPATHAYLHATAANLVSAGVRLVPLGQTDGQIATARLASHIETVAARAMLTPVEDLGSASPLLELASFHHETLYTRLFRS
ncbi:urease accessory protein UreF [Novosphingobium endophyticum]|nr:urease accessory protein UreF [Novosphingobium endophyticum]